MKNINDITKNIQSHQGPDAHKLQGGINPRVKQIIDELFTQLAAIFPAWKYNWKTEQEVNSAKKEWVKALHESEVNTIEQIKIGVAKARASDSDFLPSPGKFISWCKKTPQDAGWPDPDAAMKMCIRHRENQKMFEPRNIYIRPMIIELCARINQRWYEIDRLPNEKAMKVFKECYQKLFNSGYVEPEKTDAPALPPKSQIIKNMSGQQKEAEKNRALSAIDKLKKDMGE